MARRRRVIHRRKRGRGLLAQLANGIPVIGPLLSHLGESLGLGIKRHGRGMGQMQIDSWPRIMGIKGGLLMPAGGHLRRRRVHHVKAHYKHSGGRIVHVKGYYKHSPLKHGGAIRGLRGGYVPYMG